ncbi:hypothetical protein GCM10027570_23070 [Streptomonospora sediminis]
MSGFLRRFIAAAGAAIALAAGASAPAAAADLSRIAPEPERGATIHLAGGGAAETSLYRLTVSQGAAVHAYCADISADVNREAAYTETSWATGAAPQAHAGAPAALNWITAHSFPQVDLERLRRVSGAGGLTRAQAIAATQAAVWHHTNGVELDRTARRGGGNAPATRKLYTYLLAGARQGTGAEPGAALALDPRRIEGADPAAPIGPLTVRTTSAEPVGVWVRGAAQGRLTDADGTEVERVGDGEEFFLRLPPETPAGVATVHARAASAPVRPGRLFAGKNGVQTQPLVVADGTLAAATAEVKVDWVREEAPEPSAAAEQRPAPSEPGSNGGGSGGAPTQTPAPPAGAGTAAGGSPSASAEGVVVADDRRPEDHLAQTGTWLGTILIAGVVLLTVGAVLLYLARRRGSP